MELQKEGWDAEHPSATTIARRVYGVEMPSTIVLVASNPRPYTMLTRSIYFLTTKLYAVLDLLSTMCMGLTR